MATADIVERLSVRLEAADGAEPDADLVEDCVLTAEALYASLRYPYAANPPTDSGARYENWVYRAALEIYSKSGAEGQVSHSENGISRTWDSGMLSKALTMEILPLCGVVS